MNVLHLATFDAHGGAGVAALRLVESLRRRGHNARLLVRDKATAYSFVDAAGDERAGVPRTDRAVTQLAWLFSQRARPEGATTPFSSDLPTYDLARHPTVRAADVLHLHWVTGFLSAYAIRELQDLGKPVVWTLHDQFPFTGGCHYAQSCRGFMRGCSRCPELVPEAQPLASLTLADKRRFIDPSRLIVAAPSQWMADGARRSALFRRSRVEVVPYGVDVEARSQVGPNAARTKLGLPADAMVILAASANHRDPRKGYAHLVEALGLAHRAASARLQRRLLLLTAGEGSEGGEVSGVPCRALGALGTDDHRLTMAYRAADVFVLPSLEDNLPNTLLEAMAAGTAVAAYNTGGVPDAVQDGVNGRLVKRGDVRALAKALTGLLSDDALRHRLGDAAGATARAMFDWPIQSEAYERIYVEALTRSRKAAQPRRTLRSLAKDPWADVPRVRTLLSDTRASRLFTALLRDEIDRLQQVIAARGGELRAYEAAMARHADTLRDHQRELAALQDVIASRGGEIRDLRKSLGDAQQAGARRKEVLSHLMRAQPRGRRHADRLAVGIFGVGEGGRRVLEAAVLLDCNIVWLADNNTDLQGHTDLGCAVMRPEAVPGVSFDAVIIASSHRDAIRQQLIALGVDPERIVAPDVAKTDAEIFDELRRLLEPRRHATAHSARSNAGRS